MDTQPGHPVCVGAPGVGSGQPLGSSHLPRRVSPVSVLFPAHPRRQVDGESEEEQESAGTGEEEDGDESDLVSPRRGVGGALLRGAWLGRADRGGSQGALGRSGAGWPLKARAIPCWGWAASW